MKPAAIGSVLLLALIALIPTWKFIGGRVPAPVDQIHQLPPWNAPTPDAPWDILQLDGALQFLPWRDLMLESMRGGEVPLWNPYSLGGAPFLANSQSAPLYPLHWLAAPLPVDAEALLSFSAWLHLFIAALGVYLLCRRLGASELGGLIGGSAMALSAFMVAWIQLPSVIMTAAWIPWCLLGIQRLFEEPCARSAAKLAAPAGLMLLAGHLQIAAYGMMACTLYAVWMLAFRRAWKPALAVLGALVLGAALAAPQLLPVLENGRQGHRAGAPSAEGYELYRNQALGLRHLVVMFVPTVFGMPNEMTDRLAPGATSYWLAYIETGRHYAELPFYVGPIIVSLALFAAIRFRRRPDVAFFGALFLFALAVALGTGLTEALYFGIPGWSATGSPGRAAVLAVVALCVLAGTAIRDKPDSHPEMVRAAFPAVVALTMLMAGALWAYMSAYPNPGMDSVSREMAAGAAAQSRPYLVALLVGLGVAGGALLPGRHRRHFGLGVLTLSVIGLAAVHWNLNPGSPRGGFNEPFEGLENLRRVAPARIAVLNPDWSLYGPVPGLVAPPNSLLPYRIHEIGGYDSLVPRYRKQQLDEINGQDSAPLANGNMMLLKPGLDFGLLRDAGVEYLMVHSDTAEAMETDDLDLGSLLEPVPVDGEGWELYRFRDDGMPRILVVEESMNEKTLRLPPGLGGPLRVTEANSRGWMVRIGEDWRRAQPKMENPFGEEGGELTFVYRPSPYLSGVLLGLLGVGALFALACMPRREGRRDGGRSTDSARGD